MEKLGRTFFEKALETLAKEYALVALDTPPMLGSLIVNSLTATDDVVILVQTDTFAVQSIFEFMDTISQIKHIAKQLINVQS